MSAPDMFRRLVAEALGTALQVAAIVGTGLMAQALTQDAALHLLANAVAAGAMLVVLITIFGPLSGAHFNPAVTIVLAMRGMFATGAVAAYVAAQIGGAIAGTMLAHAMFAQPILSQFALPRTGMAHWLAEAVASAGLILVILGTLQARRDALAQNVGLYIIAAYWFTASTSFANPAVTIGRAFTASFSGIRIGDVPAFVMAQLLGATAAAALARWLFTPAGSRPGQ